MRRAALTSVIFLITLFAAAVAGLALLKSSRAGPMHVDVYPGASVSSQTALANSDRTLYVTDAPIDRVAAFYIAQFGQSEESGCKQLLTPPTPPAASGQVYYRCVSDQSVLGVTQITTIKIDSVPVAGASNSFQTRIEVDRIW